MFNISYGELRNLAMEKSTKPKYSFSCSALENFIEGMKFMQDYFRDYIQKEKGDSSKHPSSKKDTRKILFLNTGNGFESENPRADIVEVSRQISSSILHILENSQRGVEHSGGDWREIMKDGEINFSMIAGGRKSDFTEKDYDEVYTVISGNY